MTTRQPPQQSEIHPRFTAQAVAGSRNAGRSKGEGGSGIVGVGTTDRAPKSRGVWGWISSRRGVRTRRWWLRREINRKTTGDLIRTQQFLHFPGDLPGANSRQEPLRRVLSPRTIGPPPQRSIDRSTSPVSPSRAGARTGCASCAEPAGNPLEVIE